MNVDPGDGDGQEQQNVYPWLQNDAQGALKRLQITNGMQIMYICMIDNADSTLVIYMNISYAQ